MKKKIGKKKAGARKSSSKKTAAKRPAMKPSAKKAGRSGSSGKVAGKMVPQKKSVPKKSVTKKAAKSRTPKALSSMPENDGWTLRLYIAGDTPKSMAAQENLKRLCDKHLPDKCTIEVIDLIEHPELARADQVLAIPTLVRKIPVPIKRIIGDLSNEERAMLALDVRNV